jgi:hypothetical protein
MSPGEAVIYRVMKKSVPSWYKTYIKLHVRVSVTNSSDLMDSYESLEGEETALKLSMDF